MMKFRNVIGILSIFLLAFTVTACDVPEREKDVREQGEEEQENIMKKAIKSEPTYTPDHFLTRKTINKWMKRNDKPSKVYYVYIYPQGRTKPIGYYVAQNRPVNICTYLTPPKKIDHGEVVPAPALDGTYYGSGGGCNQWFFFDATTDALIEITTDTFGIFSSDQPLKLDAPKFEIAINNDGDK